MIKKFELFDRKKGRVAKRTVGLLLAMSLLTSCAVEALKMYDGPPKLDTDVSILRLWGPGVMVLKVDGKDAMVKGTEGHAYLLPGDHTLEVKLVKLAGYNLLCGALCDSIFNRPKTVETSTQAGRSYTVRYVDDAAGTIAIDDKGTNYDPLCLDPRRYREGKNC